MTPDKKVAESMFKYLISITFAIEKSSNILSEGQRH